MGVKACSVHHHCLAQKPFLKIKTWEKNVYFVKECLYKTEWVCKDEEVIEIT